MNVEARTIAEMQNRPTAYEVILTKGETKRRVSFIARKSKVGLYKAMIANGPEILEVVEADGAELGEDDIVYSKGAYFFGSTGWELKFSGRTERTCAEE